MFKRLRERIAEEATKFPVGQLSNNSGRPGSESENKPTETNSTEDLITLSDSSSVFVPYTSSQQFSIGEEEDGSLSEQSTPQKKQNVSSGDTNTHPGTISSGHVDLSFGQEYRPSKRKSYVPQSDIESEREDPPTLNLDGISKEQLMAIIQQLKARSYKYKNKYSEVVKNYRELQEEKTKIENTLIENQDKGLRRIAELREQCQLEQKAKAHLEENLRLLLEEKDSRICVLETQINLLKEGGKSSSTKTFLEDCDNQLSDGGVDTTSEDSATSTCSDISALQGKVERLQHQCNQDKKTITAQTEQIALLRKQNENLSQELEEKVKSLNDIEDVQSKLNSEHESVLKSMQDRLNELEKQQEENVMSMAETKKNMHEELELKEKQLVKAEEESKQFQAIAEREKELVSELKKQHEEKVKELQRQLEMTEKTLEDEKQNLLHELGQGKTAAINLMQQECAKKIAAIEDEWKTKYEDLHSSVGKASQIQVEELVKSVKICEEKLEKSEQLTKELEKENTFLKNSVEKLESEIAQGHANYEKLKVSCSDYDNLKEKEKLLKIQETINRELHDKVMKYTNIENELKNLCENLTIELNEKKNLITKLEKEKSVLIEKIEACEIVQKELENIRDNLENEIKTLKEEIKSQTNKMDNVILENASKSKEIEQLCEELKEIDNEMQHMTLESASKSEEIGELQEKLIKVTNKMEIVMLENDSKTEEINDLCEKLKEIEINEKLATEKLGMSLTEMTEFETENAELACNIQLLNDEIANLKCMLGNKEKELQSINDSHSKAEKEILSLNEILSKKETMLKHVTINHNQIEAIVASLEKQQACLKIDLQQFQDICETVLDKSSMISEKFEMITKESHKASHQVADKSNLENEQKAEVKTNDENSKSGCDNVLSESVTNVKSPNKELVCLERVAETLDAQDLHDDIAKLKIENATLKEELYQCKTSAELQAVEFAKNITMLHQSLSDLQEERNNLSLVLQNIENTQFDSRDSLIQNEMNEERKINDERSYRYDWEKKIALLNAKVKLEIEALSSQTEVVNKELKCLREQFASSQEAYSEKLTVLNSKLLSRTETVFRLKEDLDSSVENANCLKKLVEEIQAEKNELLATLERNKKELENKSKNLKQEYYKKECELKETHNSQLVDLKNHTKSTIEKLSEELKKLNQKLKEKDEEFSLKLSNTEKNYELQISDLKSRLENVVNCQIEINKFSDLSNSFETILFDSVSKLDTYSSKVANMTHIINKFVVKLKEKDNKIFEQSNAIGKMQEEIKHCSELKKDFNDIQHELNTTRQLLEDANKQLHCTKERLNLYELENSDMKTNLEKAKQKVSVLSASACNENELHTLLEIANQELETLKEKQSKMLLDLDDRDSQIQELQEKYNLATIEVENLNKLLNQEKINLEEQKSVNNELINKYQNFASQLEAMSRELRLHFNKTLDLMQEKENQIENIESKLSVVSLDCANKIKDLNVKLISALKELENCQSMLNERKEKVKNSENIISDWKLKYECILESFDEVSVSNENFQLMLDQKEYELIRITSLLENSKNEMEKLKLQIETQPSIQTKLDSSLDELQNCQALLNKHATELAILEKEKQEYELLYNEQVAKLKTVETEKNEKEVKFEEQIKILENLQNEKCELELKYKEKDEKLSELKSEKLQLESNCNEKLLKLESEKQAFVSKYEEKLNKLECEKRELEIKLNSKNEELNKIENKIFQLESNYGDKLDKLENEKHELESKYVEKLEILESEKHKLASLYYEENEKLTKLKNESESKYNEVNEKLCKLEIETHGFEVKHKEQAKILCETEKKNHELELKLTEQVEKLKILEAEKHDTDIKFNELVKELEALKNLKLEFESKYNEEIEKINNIQNERCKFEEKFNKQTETVSQITKKCHEFELEYSKKVEEFQTLLGEKHELQINYSEQIENLKVIESEKLAWIQKHNELIEKIKVLEKRSQDLKKLNQNFELEIQKHLDVADNFHLQIKTLSESIAEKDSIIKTKETEKENIETRHEESLRCMKDKLQNAEKNYKTQIEEMKLRINQLEKENNLLLSEKENLLIIQNQFKELKNGEENIQAELRLREEEVKVLKEKLDALNKEQVEKIHTFQENMKDKENRILKLKANIESSSKEHKESVDELQKKIKRLEVEREQLMLQAQERVSITEAKCREALKSLEEKCHKCREDVETLQEKCEKLQRENSEIEKLRNQLDESLLVAESNQTIASKKISLLNDQLANAEKKLAEVEKFKLMSESEFTNKLEKLQQENKLLLHNSDHVETLKAEKEELNEQLKTVVQQVNKIDPLQAEKDILKRENEELAKEISQLRTVVSDSSAAKEKLKSLESTESSLKQKIDKLNSDNEKLKLEIESLKNSFGSEKDTLILENEKLLKRVEQLESCVADPQNSSVQDYIETLKKEYEMAIKAKDDDMLSKLKQLVKDFSIQMDVKDKDSEQMISELIEKNQHIEEKLEKEYSIQMQALREDLLEKECALEEMRDSHEEAIQEKNTKIKEQELLIKNLSQKDNCAVDSMHNAAEPSDWDDTWVVPDEVAEISSPNDIKTCDEHVKQIESLEEELSKCNSEIKELKVLLRLSPPDTMVNNNNQRDSLHSLPEPTEFEYLKNIIYEYMMGKEPVTLAKVIAAVLRFNDVQTQQVIRREEARHTTR